MSRILSTSCVSGKFCVSYIFGISQIFSAQLPCMYLVPMFNMYVCYLLTTYLYLMITMGFIHPICFLVFYSMIKYFWTIKQMHIRSWIYPSESLLLLSPSCLVFLFRGCMINGHGNIHCFHIIFIVSNDELKKVVKHTGAYSWLLWSNSLLWIELLSSQNWLLGAITPVWLYLEITSIRR